MLLRNYYNLSVFSCVVAPFKNFSYSEIKDGSLAMRDMSGNLRAGLYINSNKYIYNAYIGYSGTFCFGTGTTKETFDDYMLENNMTSNLTLSDLALGTPTYDENTKKWSNLKCVNITNQSSSDITISEVGIYDSLYYSSSYTAKFLLYRKVLDEPFTIASGQTVTYNHKIEFQMPTV